MDRVSFALHNNMCQAFRFVITVAVQGHLWQEALLCTMDFRAFGVHSKCSIFVGVFFKAIATKGLVSHIGSISHLQPIVLRSSQLM